MQRGGDLGLAPAGLVEYTAVLRFDEAGVSGRAATGIEKFLVLTTEIRKLDAGPATIIEEARE